MSPLGPEAAAFDIDKQANWPEAVAELQRFDGLKVSMVVALDRLSPLPISSCLGKLGEIEFSGEGINHSISMKVGDSDVTINLRHFVGAEVTAGYAAFRLEGIHLSFARWVPEVGPRQVWSDLKLA